MPYNQRPSEYFGWYFRYNTRTTYSNFGNAGMDLFASPADQNQDAWLDLTNVMPAMSGGFRRRWGIKQISTNVVPTPLMNPCRTVFYNVPADASIPGSSDVNRLCITDGTNVEFINDTGSGFASSTVYTGSVFTFTPNPTGIYGLVSREYLYLTNGLDAAKKVTMITTTGLPLTGNWGITKPPSEQAYQGNTAIVGYGTGSGYTSAPTVTISDSGGGTGTGATAIPLLSNQHVKGFIITNPGSGYTAPVVSITGGGGTGAQAIAYTDLNNANTTYGKIVAILPAGPLAFAGGRTYTFAHIDGNTGTVSDISAATATTITNQALPNISNVIFSTPPEIGTSGQYMTPGWTHVDVTVTLPAALDRDAYVTELLLLATSDGGSLTNLYEIATLPESANTTYSFTDTTPDSYSGFYTSGTTLLTNQIYASDDGFGNQYGIIGNLPAPTPLLYPTFHQGRIFGTDGKTVFFTKSIVDVTTASGLITSKWEDAWPGDNQIPIALTNEVITSLQSDGTNLHIGTTKNMYTMVGSDPSSFSVANTQFSETGVLSNDLFTVVYAQGQPAGFMWITPDYKVMWSDFNTYQDVGVPIYPLLEQWDSTFTNTAKMCSFTSGPYNLVALCYKRTSSASAEFLIFETSMRKWYRWEFGSPGGFLQPTDTGPLVAFAYTHPATGERYLYFTTVNTGSVQSSRAYIVPPSTSGMSSLNIYRFDPSLTADLTSTGIGWNVQTTWQYLDDPQVIKVVNEIDFMSDESNLTASIWGAMTQHDFDAPTLLKSGSTTTGPLGNMKLYAAGTRSKARFYSFQIGSTSPSLTTQEVLAGFTVEHCPISRI